MSDHQAPVSHEIEIPVIAPVAVEEEKPERLQMNLMQIVGDELFAGKRTDGTGFAMYPAPAKRQWMEHTVQRYAYRCLPLSIANQFGYWMTNPVGFTVRWSGEDHQRAITFSFDKDPPLWSRYISSLFGYGIITWNMPFLFRTKPTGSQLLITGPANRFKRSAQALQAVIETDWMTSSFTMNWRLLQPNVDIRFEAGEPIMQVLPMLRDQVIDLEAGEAYVSNRNEEPEMFAAYERWKQHRDAHRERQETGKAGDNWQKDYFQGRDIGGGVQVEREHHTKVRTKPIRNQDRLGLDSQDLPNEENLSVGAQGAAPVANMRVFFEENALRVQQRGESLAFDWPADLIVLWRGGCDFEFSGSAALRPRVQIIGESGILRIDTGVIFDVPKGYKLRLRGMPQPASSIWRVRELFLTPGSTPASLALTLEFMRTDVAAALRAGLIGQVELVADAPRLVVAPSQQRWW